MPLLIAAAAAFPAAAAPLPADQAFRLSWKRTGDAIQARWVLPKGYYLYREHITAKDAQGRPLAIATAKGRLKADPTFGMVEVYYGKAAATIRHQGAVTLTYRGCQEDGLCYLPVTVTVPAR